MAKTNAEKQRELRLRRKLQLKRLDVWLSPKAWKAAIKAIERAEDKN